MPTSFLTPEQWRRRAKEARALADQMHDPDSKRAMLRVATIYEKIAKREEARLAAVPART
jgi:hypothetical protein